MKTNYVLIDYENVQPEFAQSLAPEHFKVIVFVGANQDGRDADRASVRRKFCSPSRQGFRPMNVELSERYESEGGKSPTLAARLGGSGHRILGI